MALIKCNEDGQMVSDKAMKCSNCGSPMGGSQSSSFPSQSKDETATNKHKGYIIFRAIIVLMIIGICSGCGRSSSRGSSKAEEDLKQNIEALNMIYPQEAGLGMIIERVLLDDDYVVYVYECDEDLISIDQLNSNKQGTKSLLRDTNSNLKKYDSDYSEFIKMCKAAKKGLEYRYIGDISGKTCIIRIPYSEL